MSNTTKNIIATICFVISFGLVCIGQQNVGYVGLGMELIGLTGLLVLLYLYNKKYK